MKNAGKVGIACGCRKLNYGSILQSYALCEKIKSLGYECEFVWLKGNLFKHYNIRIGKILGVSFNSLKHPSIIPRVFRSIRRVTSKTSSYSMPSENRGKFEEFNRDNIHVKHYTWEELKKTAQQKYCKFVCGSDQIWNSYEYYLDPMYFLRFTSIDKRIAYAPSFGTDTVSYYNRGIIQKYISEFNSLSVREESGRTICKDLIGKDVPVVADPTFLLDKGEWQKRLDLQIRDDEYCLVYFLNYPNEDALDLIKRIRSEIPVRALPLNFDCYDKSEIVNAGPREFLELLMNAKYVITDSFHGTILSINFEKQFVCFERQYASIVKQSSRITDVLKRFHLGNRYNISKDDALQVLKSEVPYSELFDEISMFRRLSCEYLTESLKA